MSAAISIVASMHRPLSFALALLAALSAAAVLALPRQPGSACEPRVLWSEDFDSQALDWTDPLRHGPDQIARIFSLGREGSQRFLHARYDGTASNRPKAIDYGRVFGDGSARLDQVRALRWRWRALRQPAVTDDPWLDMAASVYVVMRAPSLFSGGRGFKFGWLARPGPTGTHQRGLLQIPLRADAPGPAWQTESVDLCALFRQEYGPCEGERVLYVGVVTDGDNTKSLAEADYASFELLGE